MGAMTPLFEGRPPRRRLTLRLKLIALVLVAAAIALIAVDVAIPLIARASLLADRDATLARVITAIPGDEPFDLRYLITSTSANPLRGEIGFTYVPLDGVIVTQPITASPNISRTTPVNLPQTVGDTSNPNVKYRILASRVVDDLTRRPGLLVAWSPLRDISETVRRLVLLELLVTAGLLVLLGASAGFVVRRELRPLESMATAADQIAAGELDLRVTEADPTTEIGRLGNAFNGMLDGIGALLVERSHGEERLRQFIADASHELRTPVAAVQGYTDLYRAGALPDDAAVGRAMDRMGFEARRMGALVDDLLTLIQADAPERNTRERVDLADLLTGVIDDAAVIDQSRTWRLVGTTGPVVVSGDRMRLHQLFANLLANVRTHTPPGTTATVSLLPGRDDLAVAVSDDGPGVPDAELPKLFDRFYRSEKSRSRQSGGSGLGLAIVAAIAGSHGGRVLASHTAGGGLTITVVLPRAVGTSAVPGSPTSPAGQRISHAGAPSET